MDYHIDETITMLLKSLGWTDNSCEVKSACWGRQGRLAFRGQNSIRATIESSLGAYSQYVGGSSVSTLARHKV